MNSYLFAFFWGICILLSLIGWGGVVNRILFPKYRADWGQLAPWGVSFSIVFGGVLNVTWTINRTVILIYLGLGLIYWIFEAGHTFDFQDNLKELGKNRKIIYDDGKNFVLDLLN